MDWWVNSFNSIDNLLRINPCFKTIGKNNTRSSRMTRSNVLFEQVITIYSIRITTSTSRKWSKALLTCTLMVEWNCWILNSMWISDTENINCHWKNSLIRPIEQFTLNNWSITDIIVFMQRKKEQKKKSDEAERGREFQSKYGYLSENIWGLNKTDVKSWSKIVKGW